MCSYVVDDSSERYRSKAPSTRYLAAQDSFRSRGPTTEVFFESIVKLYSLAIYC